MSKGFGKFVAGAAIGAGLGILFAPKKGSETRQELKEKLEELLEKAKDIDYNEAKAKIEEKIDELKKEVAELDKEKVLKIAKKKSREIIKKANELVDLAVEKGTPVVQKVAEEARAKTIEVLEDIIFKLEKKEAKTTKK
ncbi:MAG TPA: YtxH domain-containing protein [Bacilli bacterium]|nr:YtxH domain-containing protein [Bacilli bacterium]